MPRPARAADTGWVIVVNKGAYATWVHGTAPDEMRSNRVIQAGMTYMPVVERND